MEEIDIASSALGKKALASAARSGSEIIVATLLGSLFQYKIYHWQTFSYAQHKAFDGIFEELEDSVDDFVETYMGKYGRVKAASGAFQLNAENYEGVNFIVYTDNLINFLTKELPFYLDPNDTDLLNIRDEILGHLNQLKYLLTLQ